MGTSLDYREVTNFSVTNLRDDPYKINVISRFQSSCNLNRMGEQEWGSGIYGDKEKELIKEK